jgi:hypothetical protein
MGSPFVVTDLGDHPIHEAANVVFRSAASDGPRADQVVDALVQ